VTSRQGRLLDRLPNLAQHPQAPEQKPRRYFDDTLRVWIAERGIGKGHVDSDAEIIRWK
jgi:hypothetical protein